MAPGPRRAEGGRQQRRKRTDKANRKKISKKSHGSETIEASQ